MRGVILAITLAAASIVSVIFLVPGLSASSADNEAVTDAVHGGKRAKKKYPWVVRFNGQACCAGSLIKKDVVLTAAHCVDARFDDEDDETRPGFDDLLVGAWDLRYFDDWPFVLNRLDWTPERHEIKAITLHPKYESDSLEIRDSYDVALVYLKKNSKLDPVPIAEEPAALDDGVQLLGWECTDDILREADALWVRPDAVCGTIDPEVEFCVGRPDAAQQACGGDSGGPYFNKVDGKLQLVGLVNRGPSCPSSWDVAASVGAPEIRAWIEEGMESIWTGCPGGAWIASNANTAGEVYAGKATSPADCVSLVQRACPDADFANLPKDGTGQCWCQFGDEIVEDGSSWRTCVLAAGPTAEPTDAPAPSFKPTNAPEPSVKPTDAPEPSVELTDAPEPSVEPTEAPAPTTVAPAWECRDSDSWTKANEAVRKDCAWVRESPAKRCLVKSADKLLAAEACPESCGVCDVTACADDPAWFKANEPTKTCTWASRFSNRLAALGEDGRYGFQACPRAARTCRTALACEDSLAWTKAGEDAKTCQWAGQLPEKRCLVKDASKVLAAEACPKSCGACDRPCVDDPTWHKAGDDETKTCVWASRFSNRLAALGEDGRYAYEACPLAARACDGL